MSLRIQQLEWACACVHCSVSNVCGWPASDNNAAVATVDLTTIMPVTGLRFNTPQEPQLLVRRTCRLAQHAATARSGITYSVVHMTRSRPTARSGITYSVLHMTRSRPTARSGITYSVLHMTRSRPTARSGITYRVLHMTRSRPTSDDQLFHRHFTR